MLKLRVKGVSGAERELGSGSSKEAVTGVGLVLGGLLVVGGGFKWASKRGPERPNFRG